MIANLVSPSVSFKGQENTSSVRSSYNELLKRNEQIAANATNNAIQNSTPANAKNNQIPMQGNVGQKLDVVV